MPPRTIVLQTEPEVPLPPKFRGSRKCSASDFKEMLNTIFLLQPIRFNNDDMKILYVSTFLLDAALTWYKNLRASHDPCLESLESFWIAFDHRFGLSYVQEESESRLLDIVQGNKERVDEYNHRFLNLASRTDFCDAALRSIYIKSLRQDVLFHFFHLHPAPPTLNEAMRAAELIDSNNRQFKNSRSIVEGRTSAHQSRPKSSKGNAQPTLRKIDSAEKQRIIDNNLCLYCGDDDHLVENCKKRLNTQSKNYQARRKIRQRPSTLLL